MAKLGWGTYADWQVTRRVGMGLGVRTGEVEDAAEEPSWELLGCLLGDAC